MLYVCHCCLSFYYGLYLFFFFFKQKTAYEMRISDWSSDVCSSDLSGGRSRQGGRHSLSAIHAAQWPAGDRLHRPQGPGRRGIGLVPCRVEERTEKQDRLCPSVRASDVQWLRERRWGVLRAA